MSTVLLHTMIKNGREKVPALLESVKDFCTAALFLDTGSADGTLMYLKDQQEMIPDTQVYSRPFKDFGSSRTEGIQLCTGLADWILLLDDDMRLDFQESPDAIRAKLDPEVGCYMIRVEQAMTYWNARLVRGDRNWKYVGVTHEYLERSQGAVQLEGLTIRHEPKHGPDKFSRDLALLSADIARDPYNARTIFYLAQTLKDMGHTLPAIRYYEMRVRMGGWDEEVFFSMFEAARLAQDPKAMQRAHEFRPTRAEPSAWLRDYFYHKEDYRVGAAWEACRSKIPFPKNDILFVLQGCYGPLTKRNEL